MKTLTPENLRTLREDITAALAVVAQRHGLSALAAGNCAYDARARNFTFKVQGQLGNGISKEAAGYELLRQLHEWLPPLGTELQAMHTEGGRVYKVAGCNTTGSKVYGDTPDGKRYSLSLDFVRRAAGVPAWTREARALQLRAGKVAV